MLTGLDMYLYLRERDKPSVSDLTLHLDIDTAIPSRDEVDIEFGLLEHLYFI